AVEFLGKLDQRAVAARGDIRDDRAHSLLDIGRALALGGEKIAKATLKIGRASIEADRHGCTVARMERSDIRDSLHWRTRIALRSMRATAQCRGDREPSTLVFDPKLDLCLDPKLGPRRRGGSDSNRPPGSGQGRQAQPPG